MSDNQPRPIVRVGHHNVAERDGTDSVSVLVYGDADELGALAGQLVELCPVGIRCPWCQSTDVDNIGDGQTATCMACGQTFDADGWSDTVPEGYRDDLWALVTGEDGVIRVQHWPYEPPMKNEPEGCWLDGDWIETWPPDIATSADKVKPNPRPAAPRSAQPTTSESRKSGSQSSA